MPARIILSRISGESEAGPMVHTILVLWAGKGIHSPLFSFKLGKEIQELGNSSSTAKKSQITNTKLQINHKFQFPYDYLFVIFNFGHCKLFDIWVLLFGI
jgi:hypothetical protein